MDAAYYAHHFRTLLTELTFNSKILIDELTRMSQDVQHARFVAQCLDNHIMTCPPPHRLPALYTMDSICKNIGQPFNTGQPYVGLWGSRIAHIFMETYRVVDQSTKARMEELLGTWRYGGTNGTPLFGEAAQQDIERRLFGNAGPISIRPPFPDMKSGVIFSSHVPPQHQQPIRTIERLDRLLAIGSLDGNRLQALRKLRTLVADMPLSSDELSQIDMQLNTLEAETPHFASTSTPALLLHNTPAQSPAFVPPIVSGSTNSPRPTPLPLNLAGALANLGKIGSSTPPVAHATPAPLTAPAQHLIAKLQRAGLFRATPPAEVQQDLEYSNMVLSLNLKLTTADMQRELPLGSLEAIMFKELPLQCRQCTNRYPSGTKGQTSMDQHLDWHFRQNRRARDSTARGQSRSWFSRLEDWIRGGHDDDAPSKRHEDTAGTSNTRAPSSLTPAQEAELKAATSAFVVAPIDDPDAATKPCPICKELFKAEMSQDEDDFIWKNAVNINGIYYHGSCHYSAKVFSSSVKLSTGSREGTPLADDQAKVTGNRLVQIKKEEGSTAFVPGTKRKAETTLVKQEDSDDESAVKHARPSIEGETATT